MQVQTGKVSQSALDVKERLRDLDPVEGLGVIAWLLGRMEQNIKPQQLDQVCSEPSPSRHCLQIIAAAAGLSVQSIV
jgi:hypothetical protein